MKKLYIFLFFCLLFSPLYAQVGLTPVLSIGSGKSSNGQTTVEYEIPLFFESNLLIDNPRVSEQTAINFGFTLVSEPETSKVPSVVKDSLILVSLYNQLNGVMWNLRWDFTKPVHTWQGVTLFPNGAVKTLDLRNNNIKGLLTTAKNYPRELYPLDSLLARRSVMIALNNNAFDFVDLHNFTQVIPNNSIHPQKKVGLSTDTTGILGSEMILFTFVRELPQAPNRYQWFKNNEKMEGQTNYFLRLNNLSARDTGTYHCQVSNPLIPALTLERNPIKLRVAPPISATDSLALVRFWQATNGKDWLHTWDLKKPVASWHGLRREGNKVVEINLPNNQLSGRIPSEVFDEQGLFSELRYLNLGNNQLQDTIPATLSKLKKLSYLDLSRNKLHIFPENLGVFPQLRVLWLHDNLFENIPDQIAQFSQLEVLSFQRNKITHISDNIRKLKRLKILDLGSNSLKNLGNFLSQMDNLEQVFLANNQIESLPNLALSKIRVLELQNNRLKNLPNMPILRSLNVGGNALTFGDLERIADQKPDYFVYAPQENIGESSDTLLLTDQRFTMRIQTDGSANFYQWQRNTIDIEGANFPNFAIERAKAQDAGAYTCLVRNRRLPDLVLQSKPFRVRVSCGSDIQAQIRTADQLVYCPQSPILVRLELQTNRPEALIRWYRNGTQIFTPTRQQYLATQAGIYRAEVVDESNCSVFSNEIRVNTHQVPVFSITSQSNLLQIVQKQSEDTRYQWFLNDKPITGATQEQWQAQEHGNYFLAVTTPQGCQVASLNRIAIDATAVENDSQNAKIWIYPNPTQDFLRIELSPHLSQKVSFRLWSNLGKEYEVEPRHLEAGVFRVETAHLVRGIYWLEIQSEQIKLYRQFVKE